MKNTPKEEALIALLEQKSDDYKRLLPVWKENVLNTVKACRKFSDLSVTGFGETLSHSWSVMTHILSGETAIPCVTFLRFCLMYDYKIHDFLDTTPPAPHQRLISPVPSVDEVFPTAIDTMTQVMDTMESKREETRALRSRFALMLGTTPNQYCRSTVTTKSIPTTAVLLFCALFDCDLEDFYPPEFQPERSPSSALMKEANSLCALTGLSLSILPVPTLRRILAVIGTDREMAGKHRLKSYDAATELFQKMIDMSEKMSEKGSEMSEVIVFKPARPRRAAQKKNETPSEEDE